MSLADWVPASALAAPAREFDLPLGFRAAHQLPECAVCGKPVESGEARRLNTRNAWVLIVRCHGQEETVEMGEKELFMARDSLRMGRAFERALVAVDRDRLLDEARD